MATKRLLLIYKSVLFAVITISSCSQRLYYPDRANVPAFTKAGELMVSQPPAPQPILRMHLSITWASSSRTGASIVNAVIYILHMARLTAIMLLTPLLFLWGSALKVAQVTSPGLGALVYLKLMQDTGMVY